MISDIVICAGGVGSRMSIGINPHNSKPLIAINGTPLIKTLIKNASLAGFSRFFISVNNRSMQGINTIVKDLKCNYKLKLTGHNFSSVPALFLDDIGERFLVVCGHDYIPVSHFEEVLITAKENDLVETAYKNIGNKTENKRRIIINDSGGYKAVDLTCDDVPNNHAYVRNPYLINQSILKDVVDGGFQKSAGYYIYDSWSKGRFSVGHVFTDVPVEFDTDDEFYRLKKYIREKQ